MASYGHLEPIDSVAHGKIHAPLGTGAATKGDGSEAATPTTDPTESAATVALRRLW